MSNLAVIRTLFRAQISQMESANSDITDAEADNFANQALRYTAVRTQYPRDHIELSVETGKNTYTLPDDFISVIAAYFGDPSLQGDIIRLKIYTEQEMNQLRLTWLETNTGSYGKPDSMMLLDRYNVLLSPTPSATYNAKKLILTYFYYPATLVNDADEPDIPFIFHDFLPYFMASLAYGGKLKNPELAVLKFKEYKERLDSVKLTVTEEKVQLNMFFEDVPDIDESVNRAFGNVF